MKKTLLVALMTLFIGSTAVRAQMPAGCIAPDFTATDINGTSWHLYDILNQGKTVFIDVSATWCSPCWSYHNTHALRDLYNAYGPPGTNELMVFFVEGDATTNTNCLYGPTGCNSTTQGDWVTGTPYPIIDNAAIGQALQIRYFPTIYMICPNRVIKEVGQKTTAQLYAEKTAGCFASTAGVDAEIIGMPCYNSNPVACSSVDISYRISNMGALPLTSADITITVGGIVQQTYNWTGSLDTYNSTQLTFTGVTGTSGMTNTALVTVSNPNGTTDGNNANNSQSTAFTLLPGIAGPPVTQNFAATTFPPAGWFYINGGNQSYGWTRNSTAGFNGAGCAKADFWNIPNGDQDVLMLPPVDFSGFGNASLTFDLSHAQYSTSNDNLKVKVSTDCGLTWTTVFNKTGTALSTTAAQSSAFTPSTPAQWRAETVALNSYLGSNYVILKFESNSNYGNNLYVDNVNLNFNVGLNEVNAVTALQVYPNPVTDIANIQFSLNESQDVTIELINPVGAVVHSNSVSFLQGSNNFTIDTKGLSAGLYFLSMQTANGKSVKQFVIE